MLEINDNDIFALSEKIFLQKINELEKYWAFNIEDGEHYSLNETSYWILEQIAANKPMKDILEEFHNNFDVKEKQGKDDFNNIIQNFIKEGIIKGRNVNEKD